MTPSNQHNHKSEVDYGSIPTDSFDKATILDQIDPLVLERENALKKKKLGGAAFVAVLLVIVAGMAALTGKDTGAWDDPKSLLENRFSSLLVDDKAFFFPSTVADDGRRALEAADDSGNPWALAWADNKDSFAAVGAYYRAKGKALAHYYKSSYDVSTPSDHETTIRYNTICFCLIYSPFPFVLLV